MDEERKAVAHNTLTAAALGKVGDSKSELDRLASYITHQEELIRELQRRLQVVSHTTPATEQPDRVEEFHLSSFIDRVMRNNELLKQIHTELAI